MRERIAGVHVSINEGSVKYPELVARQVETAIIACKQRVVDEGGTLGRVEDGKIIDGNFIEVMIVVEARFITEEDANEATGG